MGEVRGVWSRYLDPSQVTTVLVPATYYGDQQLCPDTSHLVKRGPDGGYVGPELGGGGLS